MKRLIKFTPTNAADVQEKLWEPEIGSTTISFASHSVAKYDKVAIGNAETSTPLSSCKIPFVTYDIEGTFKQAVDLGETVVKEPAKILEARGRLLPWLKSIFRGGMHGGRAAYYEQRHQYAGDVRSPELQIAAHRVISTPAARADCGLVDPRCRNGPCGGARVGVVQALVYGNRHCAVQDSSVHPCTLPPYMLDIHGL